MPSDCCVGGCGRWGGTLTHGARRRRCRRLGRVARSARQRRNAPPVCGHEATVRPEGPRDPAAASAVGRAHLPRADRRCSFAATSGPDRLAEPSAVGEALHVATAGLVWRGRGTGGGRRARTPAGDRTLNLLRGRAGHCWPGMTRTRRTPRPLPTPRPSGGSARRRPRAPATKRSSTALRPCGGCRRGRGCRCRLLSRPAARRCTRRRPRSGCGAGARGRPPACGGAG